MIDIRLIEHAHVNDDLARVAPLLGLKAHAEPAVRFIVLLEAARCHGIGKNKKRALASELLVQALQQKIVLAIEHRLEPNATHISIRWSVNRIAKGHIVSRHRLGDRAGRAAHAEEPARHFLAGADLDKRPVLLRVQINLECLLVGLDVHLGVHMPFKM